MNINTDSVKHSEQEFIEITMPGGMYDQFMHNSAILERVMDILAYDLQGLDRPTYDMEALEGSIGITRKLQEWTIQYSSNNRELIKERAKLTAIYTLINQQPNNPLSKAILVEISK